MKKTQLTKRKEFERTIEEEPEQKRRRRDDFDDERSFNAEQPQTHEISVANELPVDVLTEIFTYLDITTLLSVPLVASSWNVASRSNVVWSMVYDMRMHLTELVEMLRIEEVVPDNNHKTNYSEAVSWKPALVDEIVEQPYALYEDQEVVYLSEIFDEFGAPLCEGTIEDQFYLLADTGLLTSGEYVEFVQKELDVSVQVNDDFLFKDLCMYERRQMAIYMNKTHRAKTIDLGDDGINVNGIKIFESEPDFHETLEKEDVSDACILSGIQRAFRKSGVKYFEPQTVLDAEQLLRNFLSNIVQDLVKTSETPNQVEVSEEMVVQTLLNVNRQLVFGYGDRAFLKRTDNPDAEYVPVESNSDAESGSSIDDDELTETIDQPSIDELNKEMPDTQSENIEEDKEDMKEEEVVQGEEVDEEAKDHEFIDDSELEPWLQTLDLNNLGDGLDEQLMKVSIRVHEDIYGKERAHREKLYLRNWFGNSAIIFQHASVSVDYVDDDQISYEKKTERERIEMLRAEDDAYFIDSDDEEAADGDQLVEGMEHRLRQRLRQESFQCIENFFNTDAYKQLDRVISWV